LLAIALTKERLRPYLLIAVAGCIFLVARGTSGIVFNDTPALTSRLYEGAPPAPPDWWFNLSYYFSGSAGASYRPLSNYLATVAIELFLVGPFGQLLWVAISAVIVGLAAAAIEAVAARYVSDRRWALVATLLAMASPAFLAGNWVIFASFQAFVPLLMCAGLLVYWRAKETRGLKHVAYLVLLVTLFILGPWYREFLGVVPLLVLAAEIFDPKRSPAVITLAALGFAHALFPGALPHLLAFPAAPLAPVSSFGSLSTQIGLHPTLLSRLQAAHDSANRISLTFLALFPPSLVIIAYVGFLLGSPHDARGRKLAVGTALLTMVAFRLVGLGVWSAFALGLAIPGAVISPLLGLWLFLTLVPFFLVYTEIVHLAYPVVPASIIIAAGLERLWRMAMRPALRRAVAACLAILVLDQALNVYSTWHVMRAVRSGLTATANELRGRVPKGATVVANTVNALDLVLFSEGWFDARFSVGAGSPGSLVVDTTTALADLIKAKPGEVYFLDTEQFLLPMKIAYHSHKFVRHRNVDMDDLGTIGVTEAMYPYLDPLALLIGRPYVPFLGPPDEVNDYYHGPARSGAPFLREVYSAFHLYRVTGNEVRN
jgi:hypothetical protein